MVNGYKDTSKYDYQVEMQNHSNPDLSVRREFSSEFEVGECWGYNRFYKIDLLESEGFLDARDIIVLKFYVRPVTYYQKFKNQESYIQILEEKTSLIMIDLKKMNNECKNELNLVHLNQFDYAKKENIEEPLDLLTIIGTKIDEIAQSNSIFTKCISKSEEQSPILNLSFKHNRVRTKSADLVLNHVSQN